MIITIMMMITITLLVVPFFMLHFTCRDTSSLPDIPKLDCLVPTTGNAQRVLRADGLSTHDLETADWLVVFAYYCYNTLIMIVMMIMMMMMMILKRGVVLMMMMMMMMMMVPCGVGCP